MGFASGELGPAVFYRINSRPEITVEIFIFAAIRCSLLVIPTGTCAVRSQGLPDPISGDLNSAEGWTPNGAPNGSAGVAQSLSFEYNRCLKSEDPTCTSAAADKYTSRATPGLTVEVKQSGHLNRGKTAVCFA